MVALSGQVGPRYVKEGSDNTIRTGITGEVITADAHARFRESILRGNVYFMSITGATPTAYVGAGAGTPLLAIHNPASSGFNMSLLAVGVGIRAAGSAAGETDITVWGGPSVLPTGTTTAPRSAYSFAQSGSAAIGFSNTALTSSTALTLALPLFNYYWATAAGAVFTPGLFLTEGIPFAVPGNEIAIGATVVITSATYDLAMYWEEVQI
ncbi:MAG TPA: hypothetical protein VFV92_09815 [Candidatus Bathyarchaeia archaeon]|nr:hypothetical protein [Candidatus Bathyarchaeia archaeon]